jgi:hypothetical protein
MDFRKILNSVRESFTAPSVVGNVVTGKQWNQGLPRFGGVAPEAQMIQNPNVASPIPPEDELTSGVVHQMKLNDILEKQASAYNAANPVPSPTAIPTPTAAPRTLGVSTRPAPAPQGDDLWSQFTQAVQETAPERGYDPETIIRQKALESAFGTSNFARERNNLGGIGAYDRDPNQAFKFKDIEDYLDYYYKLIESRYPKAYENRDDPEAFVKGLKAGGYASDPNYVWKVLNTPLARR